MDLPEQIVFKSGLAAYEYEYKFNSFLPQVGDIVAGLVLQAARNINNEYSCDVLLAIPSYGERTDQDIKENSGPALEFAYDSLSPSLKTLARTTGIVSCDLNCVDSSFHISSSDLVFVRIVVFSPRPLHPFVGGHIVSVCEPVLDIYNGWKTKV